MTPDKDLEAAAERAYKKITGDGITPISTKLFQAGAEWQLHRVLWLLRINYLNGGKGMADWLESKLTPGQKDVGE